MAVLSGALFTLKALQSAKLVKGGNSIARTLELGRLLTIVLLRLPLFCHIGYQMWNARHHAPKKDSAAAAIGLGVVIPLDLYWLSIMFANIRNGAGFKPH